MKRREFITLLGGSAVGWSLAASAQTQPKIPRVGFVFVGTPTSTNHTLEVFRQALRELGYVEGQTILLEIRWAEGRVERLPELVAELVGLKVDVLVQPVLIPARTPISCKLGHRVCRAAVDLRVNVLLAVEIFTGWQIAAPRRVLRSCSTPRDPNSPTKASTIRRRPLVRPLGSSHVPYSLEPPWRLDMRWRGVAVAGVVMSLRKISAELAADGHKMARKYRGSEVPRPFNPATIKAMIEGPMPCS